MAEKNNKKDLIIDSLERLLKKKTLEQISIAEIAKNAGIGKGSIYYYFNSKEDILYSLIERRYAKTLSLGEKLINNDKLTFNEKIARLFDGCRRTAAKDNFKNQIPGAQQAYFHQKYIQYVFEELKPILTTILKQGIESGDLIFDDPEGLTDIIILVLTVRLDNTICPGSEEEINNTLKGLTRLLSKITADPEETLSFLMKI